MKRIAREKLILILAICFLFAHLPRAEEIINIPEISIPTCSSPPIIDGIIKDECWKKAEVIETLINFKGEPGATTDKHKVFVTRDDQWLYVAFIVAHPIYNQNDAKYLKHDELVQREDNVQISFDPGTSGERYYQFLLNKANTRADFRMARQGGRDRDGWNIPWRSATKKYQDSWTAEIALPFSLIALRGEPEKARMNFIIANFIQLRDLCNVKIGQNVQKYSWTPLTKHFHEPEQFGKVKGLAKVDFKAPFLPFVKDASVTGYYNSHGKDLFDIKLNIENISGISGKIKVEVSDKTVSGETNTVFEEFNLDGNETISATIPIPAGNFEKRTLIIAIKNSQNEEELQRIHIDETSKLDLFSAFLNRNYYTSEKEAIALCKIGLPRKTLKKMALTAKINDKLLGTTQNLKPISHFTFSLSKISKPGVYDIAIQLLTAEGKLLTEKILKLIKRPPNPGCEWKIDLINLNFLKNGKSFFPYGVIFSVPNAKQESEHLFKEAAEAGFDTVIQWSYHDRENLESAKDYLATAAKYKLNVVMHPECFARLNSETKLKPVKRTSLSDIQQINHFLKGRTGSPIQLKGLLCGWGPSRNWAPQTRGKLYLQYFNSNWPFYKTVIENTKTYPNLMGYFILDEPLIFEINQDFTGKEYYKRIQEVDGYHPVFVNFSSHIPDSPRAINWCDTLGTDPYWIPGGRNYPRNSINWVPKIVANTVSLARKYNKVPWTVPMAEYWGSIDKRPCTPQEQRCQTYLSLINGTKGIFYFIHPVKTLAMFKTFQLLSEEMKTLGPICMEPAIEQSILYNGKMLNLTQNAFTDVQVSLKRNPEGGYALLCANTKSYPVKCRFELSHLKDSTVGTLFTTKQYPVKDSSFTDTLEAFGTRGYRLTTISQTSTEPIQIAVSMTKVESNTPSEKATHVEGRTGKKNILRNPSFEENSLPHWPDYYKLVTPPLSPSQMIGDSPGSILKLDTTEPFHGKKSLKLTNRYGGSAFFFYLSPKPRQTTNYVLSAWMKANKDGTKVRFWGTSEVKYDKTFTLSTTWKRYSVPLKIPSNLDSYTYYYISLYGNKGDYNFSNRDKNRIVWIDAMQFEQGDKATEFQP